MLSNEELRRYPQRTLDTVCEFLGIARINVTAFPMHHEAAIASLLESVYPQFGPRTGWKLDGEYEPMEGEVKAQLKAFFAPYNRALFEYLNRSFPEWE